MNELIGMIVDQFGLDEAIARQIVEVVVKYLKDKLPAPIAGQLDNFLQGGEITQQAGGIMGMISGLFGGK